jgi:hypothetical protein
MTALFFRRSPRVATDLPSSNPTARPVNPPLCERVSGYPHRRGPYLESIDWPKVIALVGAPIVGILIYAALAVLAWWAW